ncbi:hypothetical protein Cgig2_015726 [Carnegiea gigantea]|uniref:Uncharacterized protein n=1 Tax=Carnegiea gigantea TaxID=171969 RepID=A0A9Q1GTN3_9CARY|nr:hypothetical protein Cgig2_015726 [Carnegiea gigantea]
MEVMRRKIFEHVHLSLMWARSSDSVVVIVLLQHDRVDKLSALLGAVENALPLKPVEETDRAMDVEAGDALYYLRYGPPHPPFTCTTCRDGLEQGPDDKMSAAVVTVDSVGPPLSVRDTKQVGTLPPFMYSLSESVFHSRTCSQLAHALQCKGEHDTMNASLLATNTIDASNTEGEITPTVEATEPALPQYGYSGSICSFHTLGMLTFGSLYDEGRDEKPEAVVVEADASGSSTAYTAGLHSGTAGKCTWKAAVRKGRATGSPHPSTAKHAALSSPPRSYTKLPSTKQVCGRCGLASCCTKTVQIFQKTDGRAKHISAFDVKELVKGVPRGDLGDKTGEYRINGFAIDYYNTLLHERQCAYPKWCWSSIFLKTHQLTEGKLSTVGYTMGDAISKELRQTITQWLQLHCIRHDLHGPAHAEGGQPVFHT